MTRAYPNSRDCEFLLYLIYQAERGMAITELPGSCEHYNRWTPTEYVLRTAIARLVEHGFVHENEGTLFAQPGIIEGFHATRKPEGDQFDDLETLQALVTSRSKA